RPIADITIIFEDTARDEGAAEELRIIAENAVGTTYSAVRIRDAIDNIYAMGTIAFIAVEANDAANDSVALRFHVKRKPRASNVRVNIIGPEQEDITE